MYIRNVKVLKENNCFEDSHICVQDGKFTALPVEDDECLDGEGCYAIPGLIDIHLHGCIDEDVSDGDYEGLDRICRYEALCGVTTICPTTMTIPIDELIAALKNVAEYVENEKGKCDKAKAVIAGINLEGPFISSKKKGAHDEKNILKCDIDIFDSLYQASRGMIKIVAVAPETMGAYDFIDSIKDRVIASVAHTDTDYDGAVKAFEQGASHVTHLYNAMNDCLHRNPGVVGAAADNDKVFVELICDGVHVHQSVIRNTYKLFGDDRIILISDSIRAAGLEDGEYTLGGQKVYVNKNIAKLADGTIAGSAINLMDAIRFLVNEVKIPLATAVKCGTINPARRLGLDHLLGSIAVGKKADFVLLDEELNIKSVYIAGVKVE